MSKRVDQLLRAGGCKANEVDHHICIERSDAGSEGARFVFSFAVDVEVPHFFPGRVRNVWLSLAAACGNDLMPRVDQSRNEEGPDMTRGAQDDNAHPQN